MDQAQNEKMKIFFDAIFLIASSALAIFSLVQGVLFHLNLMINFATLFYMLSMASLLVAYWLFSRGKSSLRNFV